VTQARTFMGYLAAAVLQLGLPKWTEAPVLALFRWCQPRARDLPTSALRILVRDDDRRLRACVGAGRGSLMSPREVLSLATDRSDLLGPLAILFGIVPAEPGERGAALVEAIVLDMAIARPRLHAALVAVRRVADELTVEQARSIFARCLNLVSQPVNPYAPEDLSMAARMAASALLLADNALDELILERIRTGPMAREFALVYASGLQGRRAGIGDGLAAGLEALSPHRDAAMTFARDSDRRFSALDPALVASGLLARLAGVRRPMWTWVEFLSRALAAAVAVIAPLGIGIAVSLLVNGWVTRLPSGTRVAPQAALTGFGILVAIHVLSSQLSAERLPGLVARKTSFPLALAAGYVGTLALALIALLRPSAHTARTLSHIDIGIVAALVIVVLAALATLISRLDPVRAVGSFERRERVAMRRSGRRLGKLQRAALSGRDLVSGMAWAHMSLSEPRAERHVTIRAPRDGYLKLRSRIIRKLSRRGSWADERVRLHIVTPLGTRVVEQVELLSVVPAEDQALERRDLDLARKAVKIGRERGIDRTAEVAGVLLGLASALANEGNVAGAESISTALLRLAHIHLRAMRTARGDTSDRETIGLVPVLRAVAVQSVRLLDDAPDPSRRDVILGLLDRLLWITDGADSFPASLATQARSVAGVSRDHGFALELLLWSCGTRAVETGDELGLRAVQDEIVRRMAAYPGFAGLSGRILQFAALNRAGTAERYWTWHRQHIGLDGVERCRIAIRAGASAFVAAGATLATLIALDLPRLDFQGLYEFFDDRSVADREAAASNLWGQLLGADPQKALQDFVRFCGRAQQAVRA
jgi:hypothetical protein